LLAKTMPTPSGSAAPSMPRVEILCTVCELSVFVLWR
jgi:hypothetical protein